MKLAGAVYLAYLGVQALRAAKRGDALVVEGAEASEAKSAFRRGLVSDLVNVKVGLFWTALVPQFLTGPAQSGLMVASMGVLVFAWLALYATAAARMRAALAKTRPARALNAAMGGMFVALAAKLARAEAA
jgi:threonine/homoserine/homoserine lactone efflux protein